MSYIIDCTVNIQAPPEKVWTVIQDTNRRVEWDMRVTGSEMLTSLPLAKGSRIKTSYRFFGMAMWIELEYITCKPYRHSAVRTVGINKGSLAEAINGSWRFKENEDGSTDWHTRLNLKCRGGRMGLLLEKIFGSYITRLTRLSQQNLKRLCEQEYRASRAFQEASLLSVTLR